MVNFFKELGSDIKSAANFIGDGFKEGFKDISNIGSSAEHQISNVTDKTFGLADHLVSGAEGLGNKAIGGVQSTISGFENIISIPLILVAGGLAFFLLSPNFSKSVEVGGRLGEQALKNPAVIGI